MSNDLKVCSICKDAKDILLFNKNKRKKDGLQTLCKGCSAKKSKTYYNSNKTKHKTATYKRKRENIKFVQQYVYDYVKARGCIDCPENDPCCLDFDHVRGSKHEIISKMISSGNALASVLSEIDKCEIRCSNCHRKKTAKDWNWYRNIDTGL